MNDLPQDERLDRRAHVEPALSTARLDASWQTIEHRRGSRPSRRFVPIAAVSATAAAAAALLVIALHPGGDGTWEGTRLATTDEPAEVTLRDGSTISAEPHTELMLATSTDDQTRLSLSTGTATFEVTRNPARRFVVDAGDVEVRVIGTRFVVRREPSAAAAGERIAVEVIRGIVEVQHGDRVRRLTAGARWATEETLTEVAEADPVDDEADVPEVVDVPGAAPEDIADPPGEVDAPDASGSTGSRPPSAAELFEQAAAARRRGDARAAERHYAAFLGAHPRDGRAGLAAFELGRLRMDSLGNPRGAIEALRRALSIAPRSAFRQDAMARLVRAHDSVGDAAGCRRTRDAYLSTYPEGRYAADVRQRCP